MKRHDEAEQRRFVARLHEFIRRALARARFDAAECADIQAAFTASQGNVPALSAEEAVLLLSMADVAFHEELRMRGYNDYQIAAIDHAYDKARMAAMLAWIFEDDDE